MSEASSILGNLFSPINYSITLQINHEKANFNGTVLIDLAKASGSLNSSDAQFELCLHASALVVTTATLSSKSNEHKAVVSYDRPNDIVQFTVNDSSLYKEDTLKLSISFIGKINGIRTFRDYTKGIFKTNYLDDRTNSATNYVIASHAQTSFARCIFPCIDDPSHKATFELAIETLDRFKVLSNTSATSRIVDESKSLQTVIFKKTPIMATSIFGFVIGDLDFIESKVNLKNKEIPLRFYTTVGSISGAAYALDVAQKSLPYLESQFGLEYPLDKLDFVALPFLSDGAMENFGLITIQSGHVLAQSLANRQITKTIRELIIHEIVHHWVGNYISFDKWDHLWLNEAFATWFADYSLQNLQLDSGDAHLWKDLVNDDMEDLLVEDSSNPNVEAIVGNSDKPIRMTQDAFQHHSYQKGIYFLRMLANTFESNKFDDKLPGFIKALQRFLSENEFKAIQPSDLWKSLSSQTNQDIVSFANSWLEQPGFPLLTVSLSNNGNVIVKQERLKESPEINTDDVLYHVPLSIRTSDGTVISKVLSSKELELSDFKLENFVTLNANRTGFYRVRYVDSRLYDSISSSLNILSTSDIISIIQDLGRGLYVQLENTEVLALGLVKISGAIVKNGEPNCEILDHLLIQLRLLKDSYSLFAPTEKSVVFVQWLNGLNEILFKKFDWSIDFSKLSDAELRTRKSILSIDPKFPAAISVSDALFKQLLHGPPRSVPTELLEPVLANVASRANQTTWKKILELVKQPGATTNHIVGGSGQEIQQAAIIAIGNSRDPALVKRVLNFVTTNIESTMVELALVGLLSNRDVNQKPLWEWFKLNYNNWTLKSLKVGSTLADHLKKEMKGITGVVLEGMISPAEWKQVEDFLVEKTKSLPPHGLKGYIEDAKKTRVNKQKVAESIESVLQYIRE